MRILSWNVQYGKSSDGSADFSSILQHIESLGDFDVICLQELSRNMAEYCRPDQADHLLMTQQFFKEHRAVWGSGFSWPAQDGDSMSDLRQEFGNITLVKSGLLDFRVHQLPQPATPGKQQMQRIAVETLVDSAIGPVSIINTHLAFHDDAENQQQVEYLNHLEQERLAHHREPKQAGTGTYQPGSLAAARMLCGDFNFTPESPQYRYQLDMNWADAWKLSQADEVRSDEAHPPTCGLFDAAQWPQGGHCRDFFWLSPELQSLQSNISVKISADTHCNLSDHQPVMLEISI
jgi:endonuclease/exonuclease/phosphatase family metal-dependent hydrolase